MAQIVLQVGANTDDVTRRLIPTSGWYTNASMMAGRALSDYYKYGCGMRFTNVTIPQGATIDSAKLTLKCSEATSGVGSNTRVSAEDVDDAPTFSTGGDPPGLFDARWAARTTARVDWDSIPAWTLNTNYDSPEIKTVIQEIVDRAGWVSGNDIVIFWEDFEARSTANDTKRNGYSYDQSAGNAPKLTIDYTVASTGAVVKANNPKFSSMDRLLPRP